MTLGELLFAAAEWLYGYWPFRIVAEWEQGVRLRFGRITAKLDPGLHMFWPGIGEIITKDAVLDVNITELQTVDTADDQSVTFSLALKYRVVDLARLYSSIQDHDATITNEVCASAAQWVQTLDYSDIQSDLSDSVWRDLHVRLEEWGIELIDVSLFNLCCARTFRVLTE